MTTRTAHNNPKGIEYKWLDRLIPLLIIFASLEVHAAFDIRLGITDSRRDTRNNVFLSTIPPSKLYSIHDDGSLSETPSSSSSSSSSSVNFAMDPQSKEARGITSRLGLSSEQHDRLSRLASLVVEWNEKINLVSRRDCREDVVFGRHILPSIALAALADCPFRGSSPKRVLDVGTGGGFPGLPLAIAFPDADFCLVDSVGKKLVAVRGMAEELRLPNVRVHHGRAEEMTDDILEGSRHRGAYDVVVGRSVAALPKFCVWIDELIKPTPNDGGGGGKLVYIIGGDIEESLLSQARADTPIDALLEREGASDKRILLFDREAVASIASSSGEVKQVRGPGRPKPGVKRGNKKAKGAWAKRDNKTAKDRGYDSFKRY
jgi:16S rRNA (guanine527-N7)-methyltransferase